MWLISFCDWCKGIAQNYVQPVRSTEWRRSYWMVPLMVTIAKIDPVYRLCIDALPSENLVEGICDAGWLVGRKWKWNVNSGKRRFSRTWLIQMLHENGDNSTSTLVTFWFVPSARHFQYAAFWFLSWVQQLSYPVHSDGMMVSNGYS